MRKQTCYYRVEGTKDGIVLFAFPTRKPRKTRHGPKIQIDEDGIHNWYNADDHTSLNEVGRTVSYTALATALNTKRIFREMIVPHLQGITERMDELMQRLEQIENKLDPLLESARR